MEILGYISGIITVLTIIPQLFKTYKTKSAEDLSLSMMVLWCIGALLWTSYGNYLNSLPMIITNILLFLLGIIIIIMIFKYKKK